jgi:hypothetical protein
LLLPLVLNLHVYLDDLDRSLLRSLFRWIVGTVFLYFLSKWFLGKFMVYVTILVVAAAVFWYARLIFKRINGARELRRMHSPNEDQKILEPLHFAYKERSDDFVSSLFGNEKFYRSKYLSDLWEKFKDLVMAVVTSFLLLFPVADIFPALPVQLWRLYRHL